MVDQTIDGLLNQYASSLAERRVMQSIARNAWRHVDDLRGVFPDIRDDELARMAVQRVLAAARSYPPPSAVRVCVEPRAPDSGTQTGIWAEEAMALVLRWVNRADFSIQFKQVVGAISVRDEGNEYSFTLDAPDNFEVDARSEHRLDLIAVLDRKRPAPRYSQGAVAGEVSVEALVMGPWPDVSHQVQRFNAGRTWFPVSLALMAK